MFQSMGTINKLYGIYFADKMDIGEVSYVKTTDDCRFNLYRAGKSEVSLSKDWLCEEEDMVWKDL